MKKNRKYNWPELLKAFDDSGLTQAGFCKQNDINPTYFSQKRAKQRASGQTTFTKIDIKKLSQRQSLLFRSGVAKYIALKTCPRIVYRSRTPACMITWQENIDIYLHRDPVDFRKAINGLSLIVSEVMSLSPFDRALFVFCNKRRSQLKVLYWDCG